MIDVTKITQEEVLLTIDMMIMIIGSDYISVSLSVILNYMLIRSNPSQHVEIKCCLSLSLKVFVEVSCFNAVGRLFQTFLAQGIKLVG